MFDKTAYIAFLLENKVVGFFDTPVKLKSGRISSFYVNMRRVSEDAFAIDTLSNFLLSFIEDLSRTGKLRTPPKTFYGVPEGATKIGVITQYKYAKSSNDFGPGAYKIAMGRGKQKTHGLPEDRDFLGMPSGPTLVIEDVTTTGGSLIECIKTLNGTNIDLLAAIGLVDRGEKTDSGLPVSEAIAQLDGDNRLQYFSLASAFDILPEASRILKPSIQVLNSIQEEFKAIGVREIQI